MQSIAVLDLKTNQITEYPDKRFGEDVHQSYFLGMVFGSDGKHLYASVGSITDPTGEKPGDTGNGIAVYSFTNGKVAPERFIAIEPQALAAGKKVAIGLQKTPPGTAISYPAGLALVSSGGRDRLLVANNLSDNVVLLDVASGKVLERFDLSTNDLVPSSFPYTCVATRDGRRAWCSLWNASQSCRTGSRRRQGRALDQAAGSLKIRSLLVRILQPAVQSRTRSALRRAVECRCSCRVSTETARRSNLLNTTAPEPRVRRQLIPCALAQSSDGKRLFVADASPMRWQSSIVSN